MRAGAIVRAWRAFLLCVRPLSFAVRRHCFVMPHREARFLGVLALLQTACSLGHEVSRVAIPDTPFVVVVIVDEKGSTDTASTKVTVLFLRSA
jgi:hypothetical protein